MDEAKRLRRLKSALGRLNGAVPAGGGPAPSVASRLNTVDELAALADEWLADTSVEEQERNRRAQSVLLLMTAIRHRLTLRTSAPQGAFARTSLIRSGSTCAGEKTLTRRSPCTLS